MNKVVVMILQSRLKPSFEIECKNFLIPIRTIYCIYWSL